MSQLWNHSFTSPNFAIHRTISNAWSPGALSKRCFTELRDNSVTVQRDGPSWRSSVTVYRDRHAGLSRCCPSAVLLCVPASRLLTVTLSSQGSKYVPVLVIVLQCRRTAAHACPIFKQKILKPETKLICITNSAKLYALVNRTIRSRYLLKNNGIWRKIWKFFQKNGKIFPKKMSLAVGGHF